MKRFFDDMTKVQIFLQFENAISCDWVILNEKDSNLERRAEMQHGDGEECACTVVSRPFFVDHLLNIFIEYIY